MTTVEEEREERRGTHGPENEEDWVVDGAESAGVEHDHGDEDAQEGEHLDEQDDAHGKASTPPLDDRSEEKSRRDQKRGENESEGQTNKQD